MPKAGEFEEAKGLKSFTSLFNPKSLTGAFLIGVGVLILILSPRLFETVDAGHYCIKQAIGSGKMTAYTQPGMFWQGFGDVYTYNASDIVYFSKHDNEGKEDDESIEVRFNDGATAKVTGNVRIELPTDPDKLIEIHKKFRSYDALVKDTVRQVVSESVILTAALMTAEESYTTKRAEFSQMAEDQVRNGVYLTEATTAKNSKKDDDGDSNDRKQMVTVLRDSHGNAERKEAVLALYGVRVTQFVIKDIDYQKEVFDTINSKQGALMKTVQAKAEAVKAEQDRLTAEEVGKKNVAVARYEQEVKKAVAVTQAQQELEVAKLNRLASEQNKQAKILQAEGDSEYRRKMMVADGALTQKLDAYVKVQQAWADAMAHSSQPLVPGLVMGAASALPGGNAAMTLMEMMAVKAAKDLSLSMSAKTKE